MVIHLPDTIENELRRLAQSHGRPLQAVIEDALRQYVEASAITDITSQELGELQVQLLPEIQQLADDQAPDEAA